MKKNLVFLLLLLPCATWAEPPKGFEGEQVFIVKDYRYDAGESGADPDTGHALCGKRCNALSVDYRNFIDPGGWRFIQVAADREVSIDLGNPFFPGTCICTADEYVVQRNEFNWQAHSKEKAK